MNSYSRYSKISKYPPTKKNMEKYMPSLSCDVLSNKSVCFPWQHLVQSMAAKGR